MSRSRIHDGRLERYGFHSNALAGLVLVALGAIFLFGNFTGFYLSNWWALFILIPGVASLGRAYELYREAGTLTPAASGALVGGLGIVAVATIFLLGLNWGLLWPLVLVAIGLGLFLNPSRAR